MFSHILVPLDGTELAEKACREAIDFAKQSGARITGFYAAPPPPQPVLGEGYQFPNVRYDRRAGSDFLRRLTRQAGAAGVRFDAVASESDDPPRAIAAAAKKAGCDVIFIASHGRRGLRRLAEGSVTAELLAKTDLPVLVYR
jgi:nucleotide-binding universal stress UspA family protein